MGISMNNSRTDLRTDVLGARRDADEMGPRMLARGLFVADVLARGLGHIAHAGFRGAYSREALGGRVAPIFSRRLCGTDSVEVYLQLAAGALALADAGYGHVRIEVAAATRDRAEAAAGWLREALIIDEPPVERISVAFWMCGEFGGDMRYRDIEAEPFTEIADNYPRAIRTGLERLIDTRAPERGRLILWRGEPGTGKSYALRALARAWAPWCSAHVIMDPDELLGRGGAYILDVLTWEGEDADRWRLLILEDAGELIAADARATAGQALSRLLNVADGLLGQGTRTLVLITTNEPVGRLHPAARRPGRCLADIEFAPFPVPEANAWLTSRGSEESVDEPTALAGLFGLTAGGTVVADDAPAVGFGFARALDRVGQQ
jgi:hypothetical protein